MKRSLIALTVVSVLCTAAQADYIDLPIKWSQVPWDTSAMILPVSDHVTGFVRADDFECVDRDPIVAVRWWGTYASSTLQPTGYVHADISFHLSVGDHPDSLPSTQVAFYRVQAQQEWTGQYIMAGNWPVYRYDAYLPAPFDQYFNSHEVAERAGANIGQLFIDICVPSGEPNHWDWMPLSREDPNVPILDWAALSRNGHDGPWETPGEYNYNLAFELMTIPEPATMGLLGLGLAALVRRRRRK